MRLEMRLVTSEVNEKNQTVKFTRQLSPPAPRWHGPSPQRVVSVTMLMSEIPDGDIEAMESRFQEDWQVTVKEVGIPVDIED